MNMGRGAKDEHQERGRRNCGYEHAVARKTGWEIPRDQREYARIFGKAVGASENALGRIVP